MHERIKNLSLRAAYPEALKEIENKERYLTSIICVCNICLNVAKFSSCEMSQEEINRKIDEISTELSICLRCNGMLDKVFVDYAEKMVSDAKKRLGYLRSAIPVK